MSCACVQAQSLVHIQLFATPWTVACLVSKPMGFSRLEYRSELPFPPPGGLPHSGTEPVSPESPALAGGFFTAEPHPMPLKSQINIWLKRLSQEIIMIYMGLVQRILVGIKILQEGMYSVWVNPWIQFK